MSPQQDLASDLLSYHHDRAPELTMDYWLPITKVNVTGSVVTATRATDKHDERDRNDEVKPTPAVVSVVTRPDYSKRYQLAMAPDDWATHHAKIDLLPDGRLTSVDAKNTNGRPTALKDILGFAGMGAGLGAIAGGPFGALFGGMGALAIAAVTTAVAGTDEGAESPEYTPAEYEKLNILPAYAEEHREKQASLLADLRNAEAKGRKDFAAAAKAGRDLASIRQRLRLIRTELALSEALYQKWLDSTLTTTTDSYDEEIAIGHLPGLGEEAVKEWYDKEPDSELQSFHTTCKALGIAIGFGYEPTWIPYPDKQVAPDGQTADPQVHYRVLRPGVLRVYAVTKDKQGKADKLWVRSTQRILVAAPGNERTVPLLTGKADRALAVEFDTTGALISISTDVTGSAVGTASALGALPAALKDAFAAGTELGTPFSAKGRAEALQAQVDEKKAREDLSAKADPNQKLKDTLALKELEARLKVADEVARGAASAAVVVLGGSSG